MVERIVLPSPTAQQQLRTYICTVYLLPIEHTVDAKGQNEVRRSSHVFADSMVL